MSNIWPSSDLFELMAEEALRTEKSLASDRKESDFYEAFWDAYDETSLEIDELIVRAQAEEEDAEWNWRHKRGDAT